MKRIRLKVIDRTGNNYQVSLGNGACRIFASKRTAVSFLGDTNKFLTKQLYELRSIYMSTWIKYNHSWGYFMNDRFYGISKKVSHEKIITDNINAIEQRFQLVVDRCHYGNGNHLTFTGLLVIASSIKEIIAVLNDYAKSKSSTADLFEYDSLHDRTTKVETELRNYARVQWSEQTKSALHEKMVPPRQAPVMQVLKR
jgi:hypothetical protein